jgi:hypothetical protein
MGRKVRGQRAVWVAQTASGSVGMMWMNPDLLTFRYIPGYKFPEGSPARPVDNRPATWTSRMVAAFNGGFQLKDGVGGYYYADRTVRPLKDGRASLIVASDGRLHVTVWSSGNRVPRGTLAIRQNLPPLVVAGRSRAKDGDGPAAWGNADHGNPRANRSALGELADGSLVFAYGSEVPAAAMGDALASVGARTAIMLDMNKSWPMGFVYDAPKGGHSPAGHCIQPRIWRDASSYVRRFSKDFVVALAPGGRKK